MSSSYGRDSMNIGSGFTATVRVRLLVQLLTGLLLLQQATYQVMF